LLATCAFVIRFQLDKLKSVTMNGASSLLTLSTAATGTRICHDTNWPRRKWENRPGYIGRSGRRNEKVRFELLHAAPTDKRGAKGERDERGLTFYERCKAWIGRVK